VFWLGSGAILTIPDPEVAREILSNKLGHFKLIDFNPEAKALIGGSIASLDGEGWARHRRIVSPAFYLDKIKVLSPFRKKSFLMGFRLCHGKE
jgi:cytochrome P450